MLETGSKAVRKSRPETHHACRSLLQKAVRRGDVELTIKVANHLKAVGDTRWLQMRTAVIVVEECWPLSVELNHSSPPSQEHEALVRTAKATKVKDAAGLGSLGYALSQGDQSVLAGGEADRHIKIIASAISRPHDFWAWVSSQCFQAQHQAVVEAAQKAYRRGGWPWDRAFMQAAAYLAVTEGVPSVQPASAVRRRFPFWVALDKHTPEGKKILSAVAKEVKVPFRHVVWTSFYFESATNNGDAPSPWWEREIEWRFRRVGLSYTEAERIWKRLKPIISHELETAANQLQAHVNGVVYEQNQLI